MDDRPTLKLPREQRPRKRTVRMRVFNFKPLARPLGEEVATPERIASPSRASRFIDAAASFFMALSPRRT